MNLPTPILAGNWKLNVGPSRVRSYFDVLLPRLDENRAGTIAIIPPALSLAEARAATANHPRILLGVQNVFWESSGAFTGEISAPMAVEGGARLALVGHSERRHIFGESNADTARKVEAVVQAGLTAVFCVGEKLDSRESGRATDVVQEQLEAVTSGLAEAALSSLVVAYEPVWAIGTGHTATPGDASEMHAHIRSLLVDRYAAAAERVPILYGGSVKPENAAELLSAPGIDGLLIGGASVDPHSFADICRLLP